ncbi:MAG: prenyltransferase [Halobacteria archaeon]|nr:prenyltransferase [Halobacteria archaeon]
MSRPPQLLLISLVYGVGVSMALAQGFELQKPETVYGILSLILVSSSVHYANEYADYGTDALTERTRFSGGSGALVRTGLPRSLALVCAFVSLSLGVIVTLLLLSEGYMNPVATGVLAFGVFFGWMYSLPPLKLAWRGLGEVDNAVLGGIALPLYGYSVQTGRISTDVILACIPFASVVFVNLLATTWPDRHADEAVGKNTLATRWSVKSLRVTYLGGVGVSIVSLMVMTGEVIPSLVVWSTLLSVPFLLWGFLYYTRRTTPFPTVAAMVVMASAQLIAWLLVSGFPPAFV